MLNTTITRRELLLLAAGAISFAVAGSPSNAEAKAKTTKKTKPKSYSIIYKLDGGTAPKGQQVKIARGKTIKVARLKKPAKRGYRFVGWYQDKKLTKRAATVKGKESKSARTLYAKWALAKYSIAYTSDGGKQTVALPVQYTIETPTLMLFALSKPGYAFGGWYKDKACKKEIRSIAQGDVGTKKLYAKWHTATYWSKHLLAKCSRINEICRKASPESDSFIFITDMHVPDNCLYSFELIDQIRDRTPVKTVVHGGDSIDWSTTTAEARSILTAVRKGLTATGTAYFVRGNHDSNDQSHEGNAATLSDAEYRELVFKNASYVTDERLYYYRDNESAKIRYFFLDTGHASGGRLGTEQIDWLKEHLLELNGSWGAVIFLHRYYHVRKNTEAEPIEPELDPNGKLLDKALDSIHDQLSAEIICVISGHCHRDRSSYHHYQGTEDKGGFLAFSTTCDAFRQAKLWDDASPDRARGTTEEQAFDVITIDRKARKIHATRIGCGSNRSFSY